MKYVVKSKPHRFWWPVKVRTPSEDPKRAGRYDEFEFKAQFEAIPRDEAREMMGEVMALPEQERAARQDDLIIRAVVDWDDQIIDEEKNAISFSTGALIDLLQDSFVQLAFWRAWGEALAGDGGRKGN